MSDNLRDKLIGSFENPTVFFYVGKSKNSDIAIEMFNSLDNVHITLVDETNINSDGIRYLPGWFEGHIHPDGSSPNADSWTRMASARESVFNMMKYYEIISGEKVDRVLNSRDDVHYLSQVGPLVENLDMNKIWIPHFHNWDPGGGNGGYCDRFVISSTKNMEIYSSFASYLREYSKDMYVHAETTLKYHLDKFIGEENVKNFHIEISRVNPDGSFVDEGFPNPEAVRWQ